MKSLEINGKNVTNKQDIANEFASKLEEKFKDTSEARFNEEHKVGAEDFIGGGGIENSFTAAQKQVSRFTAKELDGCLRDMNKKTSTDPMGISNKLLKIASDSQIFKEKVLKLLNECLEKQLVPKTWNHSVVTMLLKSGMNPNDANRYRPISLTPCLARLYERLVLRRLMII